MIKAEYKIVVEPYYIVVILTSRASVTFLVNSKVVSVV
jgi:hypothetical protein